MGESRNIGALTANMIKTSKGEHCLFRGYGLADIDGQAPRRSNVQAGLAEFLPGARCTSLSVSVDSAGHVDAQLHVEEG